MVILVFSGAGVVRRLREHMLVTFGASDLKAPHE
jgi:hypothetical protein